MDLERWQQIDKLLKAALELPPAERDAFLEQACMGDQAFEREVRSLLSSDERAGTFLQDKAIDVAARKLAVDPSQLPTKPIYSLIGQTDRLALPCHRETGERRNGRRLQGRGSPASPACCGEIPAGCNCC